MREFCFYIQNCFWGLSAFCITDGKAKPLQKMLSHTHARNQSFERPFICLDISSSARTSSDDAAENNSNCPEQSFSQPQHWTLICPDCKMYLLKLLNVLCQSDPSVSHSTQSLGPAHTPRGLKSDIWFLRYVTKYDTIHQNCNKKCVTVATAFSETGQTDWMSYWGERWGEGGFECESDTKIYQNINIL